MNNKERILNDYEILGVFYVKKELYRAYVKYYNEIDALLLYDKPIPAALLKRFIALIHKENWIQSKHIQKLLKGKSVYTKKVIDYFSKPENEEYLFEGESTEKVMLFDILSETTTEQIQHVPYSFKAMIDTCIHAYFTIGQVIQMDKNDIVVFFFNDIQEYTQRHFTEEQLRQYKPFRMKVIAAYLTMSIGMKLWEPGTVIPIMNKKGKYENKSIHTHFRNKDLENVTKNALRAKKRKA